MSLGGENMIINNEHNELGMIAKYLVAKKCYFNISTSEVAHSKDMIICAYSTKEEMNLDYRRFVIISRPREFGLIAYGDITENGDIVYDLSTKQIVEMYEKWEQEGKPEKELSQKHGNTPSMEASRIPRLYEEEMSDILYSLQSSDFSDEKSLDKISLRLKKWIQKNVPYGFVENLKDVSEEFTLSDLCNQLSSAKPCNHEESTSQAIPFLDSEDAIVDDDCDGEK